MTASIAPSMATRTSRHDFIGCIFSATSAAIALTVSKITTVMMAIFLVFMQNSLVYPTHSLSANFRLLNCLFSKMETTNIAGDINRIHPDGAAERTFFCVIDLWTAVKNLDD